MLKKLLGLVRLEGKPAPTTGLGRLRALAAAGIVIVSVAAAVAIVAASVYDDEASHEDGLYRQQLLAREATARTNEEAVSRDLALFGNYEQHADRARDLRTAAQFAGAARAEALRRRAERELALTAALRHDFQVAYPWRESGEPAYDPAQAYEIRTRSVYQLHTQVEPRPLRHEAKSARDDSVGMTAVAALFLAALLFFTLTQIWAAKRPVAPLPDEWPPIPVRDGPRPGVLRAAYTFFGFAIVFMLGGLVFGLVAFA